MAGPHLAACNAQAMCLSHRASCLAKGDSTFDQAVGLSLCKTPLSFAVECSSSRSLHAAPSLEGRVVQKPCFSGRCIWHGRDDESFKGRRLQQPAVSQTAPRRRNVTISVAVATSPAVGPCVALPLDYYKILGTELYYKQEAIEQGYRFRIDTIPEEGYSLQARAARLEILRGARDLLSDPIARKDYNEEMTLARAASKEREACAVDVPLEKVPGALCVLQEAGEAKLVVEIGERLLEEKSFRRGGVVRNGNFEQDVALATALAYVDLYRETMAILEGANSADARIPPPPGTLGKGFEYLETAMKVLQNVGGPSLAPKLQEEIDEVLRLLTPQCILDLLALPLDSVHSSGRKEGLEGVRTLLWNVDESGEPVEIPGGMKRVEFIHQAFRQMTTIEQIEFDQDSPETLDAEAAEAYSIALALVARGFFNNRPSDIKEADARLAELEERSDVLQRASKESEGFLPNELSVERAMCALLLGQVGDCLMRLGLDEDPPTGDLTMARFVYENSPEASGLWWNQMTGTGLGVDVEVGRDWDEVAEGGAKVTNGQATGRSEMDQKPLKAELLSGLCVALHWWLEEILIQRFRDLEGKQVSLRDYFDAPVVINELDGLERGSALCLNSIKDAGAQAGGAARQALAALRALRGVLANGKFETDEGKGNAVIQNGAWQQRNGNNQSQYVAKSEGTVETAIVARNRSQREFWLRDREVFGGSGDVAMLSEMDREAAHGSTEFGFGRGGNGLLDMADEEGELSAAREQKEKSSWWNGGKMVLLCFALGSAIVAGYVGRKHIGGRFAIGQFPAAVSEISESLGRGKEAAEIRIVKARQQKIAQNVLTNWQEVKAAALGTKHDIGRLEEILEGPMLDKWRAKAVEARINKWRWEFTLLNLKIGDVQLAPDGHRATVEATIEESARLFDPSQLQSDSYRDAYTVHYDLVLTETGWKICDGTVLR